jgi:hypothetical protein
VKVAGFLLCCGALVACSAPSAPQRILAPRQTVTITMPACVSVDGRADQRCTSGSVNPRVNQGTIDQTICRPGWTKTIRPSVSYTNQLKVIQMARYGEHGLPKLFEEDHLISLEIGGNPTDPLNLWPEPRNGLRNAGDKEREENDLHRQVCAHTMTLADAQATIIRNWRN